MTSSSQRNSGQVESNLKFHSIEKITTSDLELEIGEENVAETISSYASAETQLINQAASQSGNKSESFRSARTLNSTLLEFPAKRAGKNAPEWRDEIKNRVKLRKEGKPGESANTGDLDANRLSESPVSPEPALVINLKPKIAEQKQSQPNNIAARALERIERSRQRFRVESDAEDADETSMPSTTQIDNAPLSLVPNNNDGLRNGRKVLPMIEDNSVDLCEQPAVTDFSTRIENKAEFKRTIRKEVLTVPFNLQATTQKDVGEEATEDATSVATSRNLAESLEDDESVAASLRSVRKLTIAQTTLEDQQLVARAVSRTGNSKKQQAEDFAPLGARFLAGAIDFFLCAAITAGASYALGLGQTTATNSIFSSFWQALAVFFVIKFVYLTAALVLSGTTIGLRIFNLSTVAAEDGFIPTFSQAALNSAAYLLVLATGGIGLITILFSSEQRAAHDLLAGTVVVVNEE